MLERTKTCGGMVGYRSGLLSRIGVPHLFTTRIGPGETEFDAGDGDPESMGESLRQILGLRLGARVQCARQVHGAKVVSTGELPDDTEADGLVSDDPDRGVVIRTADCVPVLIASEDGSKVAAVHAGWKGLVAGVLPEAVAELGPGPLVAAIGPCLSRDHFEVGREVAEAFETAGLGSAVSTDEGPRPHVDLRRAAELQLFECGLKDVDVSITCTWDDEECYSHRRDVTHGGRETTGRLAALIAPIPEL